jgi:predicted 2-oxoglutarate/Fe(II)-dependent dioxygenase YbiX
MTTEQSNFTDAATFNTKKMASLEIVSINLSELFIKEECNTILNSCIDELWLPSTVIGDASLHKSRRQKLRGDVQGFPFLNIRSVTKAANEEIYDFSLLGIIDQDYPQVFKYSETDYYNYHIDLTPVAPSRKLTFIINLTPPEDYSGGSIEFLNTDTSAVDTGKHGSCLIFPAYIPYKINPVTKGTKCIIVGHVHGALFK